MVTALLAVVAVVAGAVAARAVAVAPPTPQRPVVVARGEGDGVAPPTPCSVPVDLRDRVRQAAAATTGFRVGISVVDLQTGDRVDAGAATGEFGTASVVKVMIAARLLAEGEMSGATEDLATAMIERSDDDAANTLWSQAGADGLEPWVADHWGVADLGSPNGIPGRWGNTHVTARGLADLFVALRNDPDVWPWLSRAMHGVDPIAADGTDQTFGVLAADRGAAVKQGWADGSADDPDDAVVNSTGYACGDRLVVVILTEGDANNDLDDARGFNAPQAAEVTRIATRVLG